MDAVYCLCGQTYNPNLFMVQCDCCKDWFHGSCCDVQEYTAIEIDKYHCPRCVPIHGPSIFKPYTNWHRYDFWDPNATTKPVQTGTAVFVRELRARHFSSEGDVVLHMRGQQLTETFFQQRGFNNPIVIDGKDGLDITIPPETFSVYDVESYIGGDKEMDVIDVTRQTDFKMKLRDFVAYYNSLSRNRVFNVVSLEFSNTQLSRLVEAPLVARRLDWVNTVWPRDVTNDVFVKPQVQKYCLMSVKDSYTDFHIDFGGTSVWYHVLRGEKIFYFIKPTPANFTLYQQWMTSSTQSEIFFADQVDQCYKCTLRQGQTMLIPTGWIHAVLTPVDSLVFGGNFLHSLNIPMQLQVYEIEKKIKTADKFKFPLFETINWYAAKKIMLQMFELNVEEKKCPANLLAGAKALLPFLKQWNTEKDYNLSNREQIPDTINSHKLLKDLAKEIRHSERYINTINPPKPERESKRRRRRPVNKDFVDYSTTTKANNSSSTTAAAAAANLKLSVPKPVMSAYERRMAANAPAVDIDMQAPTLKQLITGGGGKTVQHSYSDNIFDTRPEQTTAVHRGGAVLKFKLGTKDLAKTLDGTADAASAQKILLTNGSQSVYDFHDDSEREEDGFGLSIDENPKQKKKQQTALETTGTLKMRIPTASYNQNTSKSRKQKHPPAVSNEVEDPALPKNGIESLLKASALTNKFIEERSGRASPSTREAIAGMLSISQTYVPSGSSGSRTARKRKMSPPPDEENINNVHQDDDYIYPSLDNSDDEDCHIFKPRGRSKVDEAWNPKARVGPLLPKMNRPAREGTKKQAVEKVLEAAAAKRAAEPNVIESSPKRAYRRKKLKIQKPLTKSLAQSQSTSSSSHHIPTSPPQTLKPRKGMKTAKQRLGKILKIHKMIH